MPYQRKDYGRNCILIYLCARPLSSLPGCNINSLQNFFRLTGNNFSHYHFCYRRFSLNYSSPFLRTTGLVIKKQAEQILKK